MPNNWAGMIFPGSNALDLTLDLFLVFKPKPLSAHSAVAANIQVEGQKLHTAVRVTNGVVPD